jgi:hypothetical protein
MADQLTGIALKAGRLARLGKVQEAQALLATVRAQNIEFEPVLTGWVLLAESIVERTKSTLRIADEKLKRAYALGHASSNQELISATSAWLAFSEFGKTNIDLAVLYCCEALKSARSHDNETLARVNIVVGDCLNLAGDINGAKTYYSTARAHAIFSGDISMQNALIYNMAAFSVFRLNIEDAFDLPKTEDLMIIDLLVKSSEHLDLRIGNSSQRSFLPLLKAQLNLAHRIWKEALLQIDSAISFADAEGHGPWMAKIYAERSLCKSSTFDKDGAELDFNESIARFVQCKNLDEIALSGARISQAANSIGRYEMSREFAAHSIANFHKFRAEQRRWLNVLREKLSELK